MSKYTGIHRDAAEIHRNAGVGLCMGVGVCVCMYMYMRILSASAVLGVLYGVPYGTRPIRPIL